jgi:hypothetical protein
MLGPAALEVRSNLAFGICCALALSLPVLCTLFLDESTRDKESPVQESGKVSTLHVKLHWVNCRSVAICFADHLEPRLGLLWPACWLRSTLHGRTASGRMTSRLRCRPRQFATKWTSVVLPKA